MGILTKPLIQAVLNQYLLPFRGLHGIAHWARVQANGLRLANLTGVDPEIVKLFAIFHDACRQNESRDPGHGRRGAQLAAVFRDTYFDIDDASFLHLQEACKWHTDGKTEAHISVQICWDADRLDLERAGITPASARMCTQAARDPDMLAWACERSREGHLEQEIFKQWGLEAMAGW